MKRFASVFVIFLFCYPNVSFAAISYIREVDGHGASPLTLSSVQVDANETLVVGIATYAGANADPISSVTFNGESLTKVVNKQQAGGDKVTVTLFHIVNPSNTTANVVITSSNANNYATAMVYAGASQSTLMTNTGNNSGSGGTQSCTISSTQNDSWGMGSVTTDNATPVSGANFTVRTTAGWPPDGDTNAAIGGSSVVMNSSSGGGAADDWAFVCAELLAASSSSSGGLGSATSTEDLINAYIHFYFGAFLAFILALCGTLYIWRRAL